MTTREAVPVLKELLTGIVKTEALLMFTILFTIFLILCGILPGQGTAFGDRLPNTFVVTIT